MDSAPWDTITPQDPAAAARPEPTMPAPAIASLDPSESSDLQFVRSRSKSSAWTIPLLCAGIAILACCLLIPAADENRRLTWERERLKADLEQIQKQVSVNNAFLRRLMADPTLSERLARRQMKMVREGTSVLETKSAVGKEELSPFLLVTLPPPAEMPQYRPIGGVLGELCRNPKSQLYLTGAALLMMASGLVLGSSGARVKE
ncbi:MAG: hypothetical protein WBD40_24195 [Tepidisphaeraceae bacterium]